MSTPICDNGSTQPPAACGAGTQRGAASPPHSSSHHSSSSSQDHRSDNFPSPPNSVGSVPYLHLFPASLPACTLCLLFSIFVYIAIYFMAQIIWGSVCTDVCHTKKQTLREEANRKNEGGITAFNHKHHINKHHRSIRVDLKETLHIYSHSPSYTHTRRKGKTEWSCEHNFSVS